MENNKKCRKLWGSGADLAFISIWEERIGELRGVRKNRNVYAEMAKEMEDLGHNIRPCDIKYKIHNLTMK